MSAGDKSGGDPLFYFGDWCGSGWSAGRTSADPLDSAALSVPARGLVGSSGVNRPSPVDAACKVHDIQYNAAALTSDRARRAEMIMAADLELLAKVKELQRLNESGRLDLNMGEVLFADNMQIAFRVKLLQNGRQVAILRTERAVGSLAMNTARMVGGIAMGPWSILVLGLPSLRKPARQAGSAHLSRPTIVRLSRNDEWMRALSGPPSMLLNGPPQTREDVWRQALAAPRPMLIH